MEVSGQEKVAEEGDDCERMIRRVSMSAFVGNAQKVSTLLHHSASLNEEGGRWDEVADEC